MTFARLQVIPRLPLFLAGHPDLTIEAILDDRRVDLLEEGIDVALGIGALADSSMTARKIGRSRRIVLGTPSYFKRAGTPATPDELRDHAAVHYAQTGGGSTWRFKKGKSEKSITLREVFSVNAAEGVREGVFADLGLCIATEWMFQPDLANGRVQEVLADWDLPAADLWALFPTGNRPSAKRPALLHDTALKELGKTRRRQRP